MTFRRLAGWTLAATVVAQPVAASAQKQSCLPPADAEVIGMALLPGLVGQLADRCAAVLPADAPLLARDGARWRELDAASRAVGPQAGAAAERAVGTLPKEIRSPDGGPLPALAFVEGIAGSSLLEGFKTDSCAKASEVFDALTPLPPANLMRLLTLVLTSDRGTTIVCRDGQRPSGPSIRPARRAYQPPPRPSPPPPPPPPPMPPPPPAP